MGVTGGGPATVGVGLGSVAAATTRGCCCDAAVAVVDVLVVPVCTTEINADPEGPAMRFCR
jgi:hypothetical protein